MRCNLDGFWDGSLTHRNRNTQTTKDKTQNELHTIHKHTDIRSHEDTRSHGHTVTQTHIHRTNLQGIPLSNQYPHPTKKNNNNNELKEQKHKPTTYRQNVDPETNKSKQNHKATKQHTTILTSMPSGMRARAFRRPSVGRAQRVGFSRRYSKS